MFESKLAKSIDFVSTKLATMMPADKMTELGKKLDIDHAEYCVWQEKKSQAQALGILSLDDAMTIYTALGSGPTDFNNQPVATKVVLTRVMAEILGRLR